MPSVGEAICVPSRPEVAPAQLGHLDQAQRAFARTLGRQRDDPVGDGELRRRSRLVLAVLADPEAGGGEGGEQRGELVQERPERACVVRERGQRLEAVDRDDPGPPLLDQRRDPLGDRVEPVVAGHFRAEVLVEDRSTDRVAVEEAERLRVAKDLLERLGDRRQVDRGTLLGRAREHELLAEQRLSRARQPHDQVDAVRRQAAAEDQVEPCVAARAALLHQARSRRVRSDQRARSEQVLDRGDELEWIERLLQEGVGARGQRLVASLQDGDGEHGAGLVLLEPPAQFRPATSGDHQLHDRELRPALEPLRLGVAHRQRQAGPRSPRCGGRTAPDPRPRDRVRRAARAAAWHRFGRRLGRGLATALLGEQPVSVCRRQAARDLGRDEAQLLHLIARVEAVSPRAALRDDRLVAVLPVADRRGRDPQHSSYRPDAVDAATPTDFLWHARDANRLREKCQL